MDTLFALIFAFTFFALFVLIPIAIFSKKKYPDKSKKFFKYTKISAIVSIASFVLFVIVADTEPTNEPETAKATESKEVVAEKEETPEEKSAREATEKAEAEKKAKADADAKAKEKSDKLAAEKEFYLNEIDSKVTAQLGMYDAAWNEYWVTTFEGISDGTVDVYTAYDNMKNLEQRYDTLYASIGAIDASGLSKENEKQFKEFAKKMKSASMSRAMAAEKGQKMFDKGDYSPSKFDEMKSDVSYADNEMMQAAVALTMLKSNLGILEETE